MRLVIYSTHKTELAQYWYKRPSSRLICELEHPALLIPNWTTLFAFMASFGEVTSTRVYERCTMRGW